MTRVTDQWAKDYTGPGFDPVTRELAADLIDARSQLKDMEAAQETAVYAIEAEVVKNAYYARPLSLYGSPQEARDKAVIAALGFDPIEINKPEIQAAAKDRGMEPFQVLVEGASALFFRAFIDGSIGAGVAKEIEWARLAGIPVCELPSRIARRALSVDETRATLAELGQR